MSALLDFAAEVRAVCEERDSLRIARADATAELRSVQRDRDILRESVKAWQEAEATARGRWQEERIKCNQARAELAGVAAQRDAHLSRSVELAARVTELEAKIATMTPAVDEVDGFRVGDLVEYVADGGRYATITNLGTDHSVLKGGAWARLSTMVCPVFASSLRRKPVEVGDAVREVHSGLRGEVFKANEYAFDVRRPTGQMSSWSRDNCIAIAPTVKP